MEEKSVSEAANSAFDNYAKSLSGREEQARKVIQEIISAVNQFEENLREQKAYINLTTKIDVNNPSLAAVTIKRISSGSFLSKIMNFITSPRYDEVVFIEAVAAENKIVLVGGKAPHPDPLGLNESAKISAYILDEAKKYINTQNMEVGSKAFSPR